MGLYFYDHKMPPNKSSTPKNKTSNSRFNKRADAESISKIRLEPRAILNSAINEHKGDIHKQISFFYKHFPVPASQGRARVVSAKTTTKYVLATHMLVDSLKTQGVQLHSVNDLTGKQFMNVMRKWEAEGMASSSLATYFSVIKRFYGWLEVKLAFESVHQVLRSPERGKRTMSATSSRSWSANGVDFKEVLARVHAADPVVALQMEMIAAFGLRVMEACAMRPIECDRSNHLAVTYGAKGGRARTIQIETSYQREVLDKAKAYAQNHNGFLRTNRSTQAQAYRRFYYILDLAQVSKAESGVSAHGLRHEFANDMYVKRTGEQAPVNHGRRVTLNEDRKARAEITEALGHSRLAITSAYLGSHIQMERANKKRLFKLNADLTQKGTELHHFHARLQAQARIAEEGTELRIFITGPAADGKEIHGVPVVLSCGFFQRSGMPSSMSLTTEELAELARLCQVISGNWFIGQHDKSVPSELSRFELMFPD